MSTVYSPSVLDTKLQKVQKIAVTTFGILLSCLFTAYMIFGIFKDINSPGSAVNITNVFERSKMIEKLLNLTHKG
jgi:hypothetical protein